MRRISVLLLSALLCVVTVRLQAEDFDLGSRGKLSVTIPEGWAAESQKVGEEGFNIMVKPKAPDANAGVQITALFVQVDQAIKDEEMQERFMARLEPVIAGSVEKKADVKKLKLAGGSGFYASFSDASLVGKPSQPGNFKVMTTGMAKLSDGVVAALTVLSDDTTGPHFTDGLKMLESITLTQK